MTVDEEQDEGDLVAVEDGGDEDMSRTLHTNWTLLSFAIVLGLYHDRTCNHSIFLMHVLLITKCVLTQY